MLNVPGFIHHRYRARIPGLDTLKQGAYAVFVRRSHGGFLSVNHSLAIMATQSVISNVVSP
ncbi:hypothetical protein RKLH11_924 [Rhodobacteraceae bacterium KLH11]|nr:hypothetical protein RKLH11_924 [Rhodobacteraceae bacterium KLH11]